ncbi:MAG: alpha/beta hydrolase, partial [Actinocatenispora sp.]
MDFSLASDGRLPVPGRPGPPWPARTVRIGGLDTQVRDTPAVCDGAEPAAYVHGLGGSAQDWTELAGLLAPWFDGAAVDLPGFGGSAPLRRYGQAALAGHVVRWLEHEGRGPVHLFGNSLGGAVTVRVAALRPDLVRSLTLISPAMPFLRPWQSTQGRLVPMVCVPGAARLLAASMARLGPEALTRESVRTCVTDPTRVSEERIAAFAEETGTWLRSPWHADAYLRTFRGLLGTFLRGLVPGSESLWRLAARIQAPTLVVWGRQDRLVPVRLAARLAATVPDSRLLVVEDAGHVAQLESPRTVARAVLG